MIASRAPDNASAAGPRAFYLRALTWSFTFFSSIRVASYLPTLWAICESGDSGQHSLWTWASWFGANLTMAGWLYEKNGQRLDRAALVSVCNAAMCLTTLVAIAWFRV